MNRKDVVRNVLIWEQVANAATARAAGYRKMLQADAEAELAEQETAPTWRLPEVATVTLPVSRHRPIVRDENALFGWVKRCHPTQVEERVRRGFLSVLGDKLRIEDGAVIDPSTGEVVPGMSVQEAGIPGSLRITAAEDVKPLIARHASDIMAAIEGALNEPHGGEPA